MLRLEHPRPNEHQVGLGDLGTLEASRQHLIELLPRYPKTSIRPDELVEHRLMFRPPPQPSLQSHGHRRNSVLPRPRQHPRQPPLLIQPHVLDVMAVFGNTVFSTIEYEEYVGTQM